MSEFFLEAKNVSKAFGGVQALKDVSLRIRQGEAHCLMGENGCGKSTLIKIISGFYTADEGEIVIEGKAFKRLTPSQSMAMGIQVIYQDFSLFGNLTVAENIAMAHNVSSKFLFDNKKRNRELAKKILAEIDVDLDVDVEVGKISVAQKQVVAICRALLHDAKLVIMDEPTSALTNKEVQSLFRIIEGLRARGIALLFVSHKLDEVFEVSKYIDIMRNGENVIDGPTEEFDKSKITYYMTGREVGDHSFSLEVDKSKEILRVVNLSRENEFKNINFELYRGEVLGITGLLGSGRTPLAETLFGIVPKSSGKIFLDNEELNFRNAGEAVRAGIGYVPEDRLTQGLFLEIPIFRNIAATILSMFSNRFSFMNKRKISDKVNQQAKDFAIKAGSLDDPANTLSGGNQQRVVLAKWMATNPKLLIFNGPTIGVDVGSKREIHEMIVSFAQRGIGVIVISDDLPEIFTVCNRVLVMNIGEITAEYDTKDIDETFLQQQLIKI